MAIFKSRKRNKSKNECKLISDEEYREKYKDKPKVRYFPRYYSGLYESAVSIFEGNTKLKKGAIFFETIKDSDGFTKITDIKIGDGIHNYNELPSTFESLKEK